MELRKYQNALEAFNSCLKVDQEYAEVFFSRELKVVIFFLLMKGRDGDIQLAISHDLFSQIF